MGIGERRVAFVLRAGLCGHQLSVAPIDRRNVPLAILSGH